MKTSKILAAAAFSVLAVAGAHAETYEGVHALTSSANRADVAAEAVVAAHSANPYAEGANSGVVAVASSADRATVRAQAVATAHNPLQSLDRRAFYRDQVPAAYYKPKVSLTRQAAL
ncbi:MULTISPECIES: alpha/beta hydrolase [unclassified Variovorax]|uniref:alpha/beta hydrolase n=1 Tax=unclassified Variovorax TaxID=663243 RepID=UPI0013199A15|nr:MULTISPECIES: alpha/beta hydrolase [unclassified Variovorax]VTU23219.1 hypothetical protein SRS16CHR_03208 [Variovorax sp. SRS16]VTU31434.1 hypothetical protein E5CHR_03215 [Variovorax sp. PBL-E5]